MDEFFDEIQRLRDAVVDKGLADDWNTLTSSMDALEDTHYAVAAFVASASNPTFPERELGERYLRMYGVMQAFAIQQDSISNFYVALGMSPPDLSPLQHIRDLRIAMAGHPTLQDKPKSLPPSPTSLLRSLLMTMVPTLSLGTAQGGSSFATY